MKYLRSNSVDPIVARRMAIAILVTVSILTSCTQPEAAKSSATAAAPSHDESAHASKGAVLFDPSLPPSLDVIRVKTGHLLVKPTINGRSAGWFIFDTGAGICVVSKPHVEELGLTSAGKIDTVGMGGGENADLCRASTLVIGPMTLRDHPFMITDLSFLKQFLGEEVCGVIGYGVLSRCVAEIDLVTPSVALHEPKSFALGSGEWIPAQLGDRIPTVSARFEGHEGRFHLDTGSNSGVQFQEHAVRAWKLLEGREAQDAKFGGVGGFVSAKAGDLAWFELGGLRQEGVHATFPIEKKGIGGDESFDGTIGGQVLSAYVLVTDYANERVAFRSRAKASATAK